MLVRMSYPRNPNQKIAINPKAALHIENRTNIK
jgi:hypothetical protein